MRKLLIRSSKQYFPIIHDEIESETQLSLFEMRSMVIIGEKYRYRPEIRIII